MKTAVVRATLAMRMSWPPGPSSIQSKASTGRQRPVLRAGIHHQ